MCSAYSYVRVHEYKAADPGLGSVTCSEPHVAISSAFRSCKVVMLIKQAQAYIDLGRRGCPIPLHWRANCCENRPTAENETSRVLIQRAHPLVLCLTALTRQKVTQGQARSCSGCRESLIWQRPACPRTRDSCTCSVYTWCVHTHCENRHNGPCHHASRITHHCPSCVMPCFLSLRKGAHVA